MVRLPGPKNAEAKAGRVPLVVRHRRICGLRNPFSRDPKGSAFADRVGRVSRPDAKENRRPQASGLLTRPIHERHLPVKRKTPNISSATRYNCDAVAEDRATLASDPSAATVAIRPRDAACCRWRQAAPRYPPLPVALKAINAMNRSPRNVPRTRTIREPRTQIPQIRVTLTRWSRCRRQWTMCAPTVS